MAAPAVAKCQSIIDHVYGRWMSSQPDPESQWRPKPYVEGFKGRYLWTDAFGVCNYLNLYYETGESRYLSQAKMLVADVHSNLGRTRDHSRWLRGASEDHPTACGLRIGKPNPEGTPDGDGQYFHYLTKWMFALAQTSLASGEDRYLRWAVEMAEAVLPAFTHSDSITGKPQLYWKMGTELQGPQVHSEGNLDTYDGYVTYRLLAEAAEQQEVAASRGGSVLAAEIQQLSAMVQGRFSGYSSNDPLDLGESLWISHWFPQEQWARVLTQRATHSLQRLRDAGYFQQPPYSRLGFRELGTTLGLQAACSVNPSLAAHWTPLVDALHTIWLHHLHHRDEDITPMMMCSSLLPGVWLRGFPRRGNAPAGHA